MGKRNKTLYEIVCEDEDSHRVYGGRNDKPHTEGDYLVVDDEEIAKKAAESHARASGHTTHVDEFQEVQG